MRKEVAIGVAVLIPVVLAFAGPQLPPRAGSDAITVAATTASDHVRNLRLGDFTALFEKTPLEEIRAKLGGNVISHAGDASESIRWLCYSLPGQIFWLISNPMG